MSPEPLEIRRADKEEGETLSLIKGLLERNPAISTALNLEGLSILGFLVDEGCVHPVLGKDGVTDLYVLGGACFSQKFLAVKGEQKLRVDWGIGLGAKNYPMVFPLRDDYLGGDVFLGTRASQDISRILSEEVKAIRPHQLYSGLLKAGLL